LRKTSFVKTVQTTDPEKAALFIKNGGIVAFPTETVYGLGADVFNTDAVAKIFAAKHRPADNPLITHISDLAQIRLLASRVNPGAEKLINAFFPGPLTIVLPKTKEVPLVATAGMDSVGIRMPRLTAASRFIEACNTPVAAPSANVSGRPSPTTWRSVLEDLDGRIDCILQGEITEIGLESTVVDCTQKDPILLRSGAITLEEIRSVVPSARAANTADKRAGRSPGLRHKHYSPRARVVIINASDSIRENRKTAYIGLDPPSESVDITQLCSSVADYARAMFEFFRESDRARVGVIYCQRVPAVGLGKAIMDRLERASAAR